MGVVIFDGVRSTDLGIEVEHQPDYSIPERDYEMIHVLGRNGDLYIDHGSYKNVQGRYDIAIGEMFGDFTTFANRIVMWLNPGPGYHRLEDSYSPLYFRMAAFHSSLDITNILGQAGRTTIEFDCKPQRYLKLGEKAISFTSSGVLRNPTKEIAEPKIIVHGTANGTGRIQIGTYTAQISPIRTTVTIDSYLQDVYQGVTNRNKDVILGPGGFPKLAVGESQISFSGDITKLEVIPRWWTT